MSSLLRESKPYAKTKEVKEKCPKNSCISFRSSYDHLKNLRKEIVQLEEKVLKNGMPLPVQMTQIIFSLVLLNLMTAHA